jgi:hypothetical protein
MFYDVALVEGDTTSFDLDSELTVCLKFALREPSLSSRLAV